MDIQELKSKLAKKLLKERLIESRNNKGENFLDKNGNDIESFPLDDIEKFIELSNIPIIGKNILLNCKKILLDNDINDLQVIYEYLFVNGNITKYNAFALCQEEKINALIDNNEIIIMILDYIAYYLDREKNEGTWLFEGTSINDYDSNNGLYYSVNSIYKQIDDMIFNDLKKGSFIREFLNSIINDIIHAYFYYLIEDNVNYSDMYF